MQLFGFGSSSTLNNSTAGTSSSSSSSGNVTPSVKETHHVHVEYDPVTHKRVLNTYEILRGLGSGQHGKVKLARDNSTGQLVAIKIVDRRSKPGLSRLTRRGSSPEDKTRREIAIMKKCDHPHIVKLIEVLDSEASRKIYMILEYLEKGEIHWQRMVDNDPSEQPEPLLSLADTKRIFRDVVSGLEYLHHQGIIHRDIKPSNLLVNKDDVVKISDFGVSFASNLDATGNDDLELAKTAGTPAFLAPELCSTDGSGNVKVTHKIDIWALGVTLYCLLFGQLPFHGDTEFQLFDAINTAPLKFPDMLAWHVSPALSPHDRQVSEDLLCKLLERDPDRRIDIDEIKQHPFFLEGLSHEQRKDYRANWNSGMKIDVTTQEVDNAVVGIGTRIRRKLHDAFFGKRKKDQSSQSTNAPQNMTASHSYILSELAGSSASLSRDSSLSKQRQTHRPSLLRNSAVASDHDTLSEAPTLGPESQVAYKSPSPVPVETPAGTGTGAESDTSARETPEDTLDPDRVACYSPSFASLDSYYEEAFQCNAGVTNTYQSDKVHCPDTGITIPDHVKQQSPAITTQHTSAINKASIYGSRINPRSPSSSSTGSYSSSSGSDDGDELLLTVNPRRERRKSRTKSRSSLKRPIIEFDVPETVFSSGEAEKQREVDEKINGSDEA